jgi:hypothetical protein
MGGDRFYNPSLIGQDARMNTGYAWALSTLALLAATASIAGAATVRPLQGSIILAKLGSTSEYLWDATPYVAKLVSDQMLGDDGLRAVEASAVAALVEKAGSSRAEHLKLLVVYRSYSADAIYGSPTFSGQQSLCEITLPRLQAAKSGTNWAQDVADGKPPSDVTFTQTGKLPPSQ